MTYVHFPTDCGPSPDRRLLGGKAAALARLQGAGLAIPEWFVIAPRAHEDSRAQGGAAETAVRPSAAVLSEIDSALTRLGLAESALAVRSSAVEEDGENRSFAGIYESRLGVGRRDVAAAVAAVWRSAFDDRNGAYRGADGMAPRVPAVIVQRMVQPEASGIAFSADPIGGRADLCVVAATRGLGDRLAAGEVNGETATLDEVGRIVARTADADGGVLGDADLRRVALLARAAATFFGTPQDIEWAIAEGRLYLLQSRPITTLGRGEVAPVDDMTLWDNSNIVESYGGVTTPLTFSLARAAYEDVYRRFARLLGVSRRAIAEQDQVFRNMLGLLRGRVYYNLLNWYRLVALLPGYGLNRRCMERMMGVGETLPEVFRDRVAPPRAAGAPSRTAEAVRLFATLAGIAKSRLLLRRNIRRFRRRLDAALGADGTVTSGQSLAALARRYRALERRLVANWDAPLVNDFFCMIAFGALSGLLTRLTGEDGRRLAADLIRTDGDVVSVDPVRRIREMARRAAIKPETVAALTQGSQAAARKAIEGDPELARQYADYLSAYADRCLAELKLESPTLREDPMPLIRAIGHCAAALRQGADKPGAEEVRAIGDGLAARLRVSPLARVALRPLVAEARARTRDRENLRFERTRVFGEARRLVVEMGRRLCVRGVLGAPADVFYLEIEELLGFCEGTATTARLGELARVRKAEFDCYARSAAPPSRFVTNGAAHLGATCEMPAGLAAARPGAPNERQGLGCSPGRVRGRARLVRDPRGARLSAGDILVAEYTDPGWVTLFVNAAGVVVERGSPLSHSAIVAREMGIPAVVSLGDATSWLADGDTIELDGRTGRVRRIEAAGRGEALETMTAS